MLVMAVGFRIIRQFNMRPFKIVRSPGGAWDCRLNPSRRGCKQPVSTAYSTNCRCRRRRFPPPSCLRCRRRRQMAAVSSYETIRIASEPSAGSRRSSNRASSDVRLSRPARLLGRRQVTPGAAVSVGSRPSRTPSRSACGCSLGTSDPCRRTRCGRLFDVGRRRNRSRRSAGMHGGTSWTSSCTGSG